MPEVLRVSPLEASVILVNEAYVGEHYSKEIAKALHQPDWRKWYQPEHWEEGDRPYQPEDFLADAQKSQLLIDEVDRVIATLGGNEQTVIRLRFGFKEGEIKTRQYIGSEIGVSRERIRQIECKTLRKLRRPRWSRNIKALLPNL